MTKFSDPTMDEGQNLRRRAKDRLNKQPPPQFSETPEDTGRLLHALQVHQIELEMQNEELRRAQHELEASQARYFDLYDLAPVGYLTLSEKGFILEANLTAGQMLGGERNQLAGQLLSRFILRDDHEIYYLNLKQLFERQAPQTFELRIKRDDITPFWVQMKTKLAQDSHGTLPVWRATLSDITARKQMEEELRKSHDELEVRIQKRTAELAQRNEELTLEINQRMKIEQTLLESKKQLRILAARILSAQEDERKRIASEVHDVLGSSLSAIKFKAEEALTQLSIIGNSNIYKSLETLIPLIQDTMGEVRRIQNNLRPPLLDDLGIVATISWFNRRFQTIYSGIRVEQTVTIQEEEVPDYLKIVLFRITQEAMNNIGKHAKADTVYLGLLKIDGAIELSIKDNGEGFDPENLSSREISTKGLGLSSMKERTEFLDGFFSIESTKGKGTVIRAVWTV